MNECQSKLQFLNSLKCIASFIFAGVFLFHFIYTVLLFENAIETVVFGQLNSELERPECVIKTDVHTAHRRIEEVVAEWRVWWPSARQINRAIKCTKLLRWRLSWNKCNERPDNVQICFNEKTYFQLKYFTSRVPDTSCIFFGMFFLFVVRISGADEQTTGLFGHKTWFRRISPGLLNRMSAIIEMTRLIGCDDTTKKAHLHKENIPIVSRFSTSILFASFLVEYPH